jgi:hypothetical protein
MVFAVMPVIAGGQFTALRDSVRQATIHYPPAVAWRANTMAMPHDTNRLTESIDAIKALESGAELPASLEQRSHRLALACRAAAAIARDRRRAGLAEPKPEPWPASTWEFLAKHARESRQSPG